MKSLKEHKQPSYDDFSTVEKSHEYITAEEFPDGPFGSPVNQKLGKSTSWEKGQRTYSAFNYENKNLHEKAQRLFPGAHPVHDNPEDHEQNPS